MSLPTWLTQYQGPVSYTSYREVDEKAARAVIGGSTAIAKSVGQNGRPSLDAIIDWSTTLGYTLKYENPFEISKIVAAKDYMIEALAKTALSIYNEHVNNRKETLYRNGSPLGRIDELIQMDDAFWLTDYAALLSEVYHITAPATQVTPAIPPTSPSKPTKQLAQPEQKTKTEPTSVQEANIHTPPLPYLLNSSGII